MLVLPPDRIQELEKVVLLHCLLEDSPIRDAHFAVHGDDGRPELGEGELLLDLEVEVHSRPVSP